MSDVHLIAHSFRVAVLAATFACGSLAFAQTPAQQPGPPPSLPSAPTSHDDPNPVDSLRDRFPSSSIDSVQKADGALRETTAAKPRVENAFKASARACLTKVLVNSCLDDARTKRRNRMNDIDAIEIEANRYKRADRAQRLDAQRAARDAEREAKAPADEAARKENRKAYESRQSDAARAAAERARPTDRAKPSSNARPPKVAPPSDAVVHAAQRAKNAADYAKKRKDADVHQAEIQHRLVEKAADDQRRADAKAVKDAKDARTAAAAAKAASNSGFPSLPGPKP